MLIILIKQNISGHRLLIVNSIKANYKVFGGKACISQELTSVGNNRDKSENIETMEIVEKEVEEELTVNIKFSYT